MNKIMKLDVTLRILIGVVLMFLASNLLLYHFEKKQMFTTANQKANSDINHIIAFADNQLLVVESASANLPNQLCTNLQDSKQLFASLARYMDANPELEAATLALDPALVPQDTLGYCLSISRTDTGYTYFRIHEVYDYRHRDWFEKVMSTDSAQWTDPFKSAANEVIIPYASPLKDAQGNTIGVLCSAISLVDLSQMLDVTKPFPNSTVYLMGNDGRFLAHPNPEMILSMDIRSMADANNDERSNQIAEDLMNHRRGEYQFTDTLGVKRMLYYATVEKTGWSIFMVSLVSDITADTTRLGLSMLVALIFNLIFFGIICWRIIKMTEKMEAEAMSKSKIENELQTASRIQMSMVPKIFPPFPERNDMDIYATIKPAKAVGGDLYDFLLKDDFLYFTIGDVSGKGVPASLFMAITRTLFRTVCSHADDPAEILTEINNIISTHNDENMFVTMQVARLNLNTGELVYSNAGHNAPIVLKKCMCDENGNIKTFFRKINPGLPIGCMEGFPYCDEYAQLSPNDCIFIYTDGVTEAENTNFELFGDERLHQVLAQTKSTDSVTTIVDCVATSVREFVGGADQSDDITALCMEWKGPKNNH